MRRSFTAKIKPEILIWARKSAGYKSVESAAIALNLPVEKLVGWEESGSITLAKLRDLARVYKRPLAVFYLQDVPKDFMALSDLRRHRDNLNKELSPGLVQEIRIAQQRRELALDLSSDTDTPINKFDFKLAINVDTELAAASIRKFLDINDDELSKNTSGSDGYKAFNFWRKKVESKGVLVFQMAKVDSSEASGFAVTKVFFPIIGINKKDPPTRRLFSLIHELTHIVIGSSSVSDLEMNAAASNANVNLERFCDRVAAATLVPKGLLLSDSHVLNAKKNEGKLPDEEISFLAKKFGVSREALLLRLVTFKNFYLGLLLHKEAAMG